MDIVYCQDCFCLFRAGGYTVLIALSGTDPVVATARQIPDEAVMAPAMWVYWLGHTSRSRGWAAASTASHVGALVSRIGVQLFPDQTR